MGIVQRDAGNLTNRIDRARRAALVRNTFRRMLVLKYTTGMGQKWGSNFLSVAEMMGYFGSTLTR